MADGEDIDPVDSVTQLSAKFDRLEEPVQGLASERPAIGHSAASAACDNDSAGRRQMVNEQVLRAPGAVPTGLIQ